ncbi:hypothetical protein J5N97_002926 [Dioscorea zingiberensis]|uniref:Pentatricopeptide repeat-containing protein n=1 Tax=Dioscorea zingiberensis TaxID=325984 RepID=A0A9D5HPL2_9LILI|nr:hypothetical protein J5N97_002926 [Dioscorea zingiberensis]
MFNILLPVIPGIQHLESLKELHGFALRALEFVDFDPVDEDLLWSAIATCYASLGSLRDASQLFARVRLKTTLLCMSMISSFLDCGAVEEEFEEAFSLFDRMLRQGFKPNSVTFIALLSACNHAALLNACRIHGNAELAEVAAKKLIELEPQHSAYFVLLSNIYADASRWNDVRHVRAPMKYGA